MVLLEGQKEGGEGAQEGKLFLHMHIGKVLVK
jgi:hypothetical protein